MRPPNPRMLMFLSLLSLPSMTHAQSDPAPLSAVRLAEADLLHRRLSLDGLVSYQPRTSSWQKQILPKAPVTVINLWSISCKPCLQEMPLFGRIMAEFPDVPFLFVADPPSDTTREEVQRFWEQPIVELPAGEPCAVRPPRGSARACLIELPRVPPSRSEGTHLSGSLGQSTVRPLTLLVDQRGAVRQAFAGSLKGRSLELAAAIHRLRSLVSAK